MKQRNSIQMVYERASKGAKCATGGLLFGQSRVFLGAFVIM